MQERYLRTLEYDKILSKLAAHARFSGSETLVRGLKPTPYFSEAHTLQDQTAEARYLLSVRPDVGVGAARDVRPLIDQAYRSIIIPPEALLDVRSTLIAARELRRNVTKLEDKVPLLADIAYRLEECSGVISQISQCIDDNANIKNDASAELARIRRELEITHSRLMEKLRKLVSSKTYSTYLQESIITQRDGRYVIPLKADFKGRIQAIVHDQSSSGATLFVEPMPVVEANNALKRLQSEEDQEIRRILLALTQKVAMEGKFIAGTVQALAEIDLVFAKARYAEQLQATRPILSNWPLDGKPGAHLDLRKARHPLLDPETVVPIDLTLDEDTTMLIITGPNTGGKTVSLKTAGLLALMAQSGLQIPAADESGLMVFDGIYADIGDEQSLEQSLSTFSSHMTNIVNILNHHTDQSLVIFDELGAGTDPIEGAALARAIMSTLLADRTTTLVATHYAELKAYAYVTPGVANASMEFDLKTLSPTYRLQLGLPGSSNAFAIAARLGLDNSIIQSAEGLVSEDSKETETMLLQIRNEYDTVRMERLRLEEERSEAEYYRQKTEKRLAEIDQERREVINETRTKARQELQAARQEIDRLKQQVSAALAAARLEQAHQPGGKKITKEVDEVEKSLKRLEARTSPEEKSAPSPRQTAPKRRLKVGDKIAVPQFNTKGQVMAINGDEIEVQLGHFRTTIKRSELGEVEAAPEPEAAPVSGVNHGGIDSPGLELDLRGQISEEALANLDAYLDQAYLAGLPFSRIIHGKGTGVLRQVVRDALNNHPLIISYQAGTEKEGGDGVTVVKLVSD